jgi:hypothetical protein
VALFRALREFDDLDISRADAHFMCKEMVEPHKLLSRFLDLQQVRPLKIRIQKQPDGTNVTAACLRTIWRFLVFSGRTIPKGKRINLYDYEEHSAGERIHRYSKLIFCVPTTSDQLPASM